MSSSNSPALVLELPYGWRRLVPSGTLLISALLLPWLVFAWFPGIRIAVILGGVALAAVAGWQARIANGAGRIARLVWNQNGEWRLQFAMGEPVIARLAASSWWSPWLICWRWVDEAGRKHALLLWRLELSPANWHQWQLRLRLEGAHTGTDKAEPPR